MRGRALEARHERARQQESARQGILAHLAEQRTIEAQARHRKKLETAAAAREHQEKEYEQAQITAWREAQELQEAVQQRLEEEQRAAAEAEAAAWEATCHQREVAALLERSAELRELKQKLQAAEVNLERSQQRDQRAAIEAREREYEAAMQAAMAAARQEAAAREAAEAEARKRQEQEARQALDAQLRERAELQRVAREEFEKERAAVDAVVTRIEEEERAAEEARARQRQMAQADIARFLAQQQELRQRQREAEAAEERSVQEYLRKRREREAAETARHANKREAQDRAYELLKRQKEEEDARREEEEALLDLLRAELEAERARRAAEERRQRQEAMRREMVAANQLQLHLKAERRAAEKAREDDFRRRMLARLEEEDRLEQMNAQKRRAKQAAHMREVERLLAFRRQLYQAMREAEEAEEARQAEEDARQAAIVEAERQRLLRQAAAQLPRDCLPKGVFKSASLSSLAMGDLNNGGGGWLSGAWSLGQSMYNAAASAVNSALGYEDLDVVDPTAGEAKGAEGAAPLSEERAKAFSSYKDYLGKDITSLVILPVWIMQPFTMLQNMGELMEHTDLLDKAAACEDPYERLAWVLGFTMGPFGNIERPWKPFNPILGETFEYAKPAKGMKFIAEQVSHHPPVGAAHAETELWTFDQVSAPKTKFLGNSVEVYPIGRTRIKLKPTGEVFSLVPPTSKANNVIIGKTWIDTYGDMTLLNSTTGAKAYLYFTPCGWFGAGRYEIGGTISREDGTPVYKLEGRWNEYLDAVKCDENGDALEGAEPLRLWTCREKPADDPYSFTHFAHELNACGGGINPLPSDSRRRPDRALLELGNSSDAAVAKYNLEEMQRAERKERERRGESWQPRWFKPLPADAEIIQGEYSNEECPQFEFTGEYLQQEARPSSASEVEVQGAGFSPWCYPDIHPQLGKESQRP